MLSAAGFVSRSESYHPCSLGDMRFGPVRPAGPLPDEEGFTYAEAGRSLPGRQGGKEKKGARVRQAGMGGVLLTPDGTF